MPLSCTYMYSYTVITHVHFVDLDILTNLKKLCRLRHFNKLKKFVDLDILTNLKIFRLRHFNKLKNFVDLDILTNLKIL